MCIWLGMHRTPYLLILPAGYQANRNGQILDFQGGRIPDIRIFASNKIFCLLDSGYGTGIRLPLSGTGTLSDRIPDIKKANYWDGLFFKTDRKLPVFSF